MKKILAICLIVLINSIALAQSEKKKLELTDILKWNRISERMISNDGEIIVYKEQPPKGDVMLRITDTKGNELFNQLGGTKAKITKDGKFVVFTIEPEKEKVRQLKLKKKKKDQLPKNELGIFTVSDKNTDKIERLKSYKLPTEWNGWIAYQQSPEKKKPVKDTTKKEAPKTDEPKKKEKKETVKTGFTLQLMNLDNGEITEFPFVTSYLFAKKAKTLVFISTGDDKDFKAGVYQFDIEKGSQHLLLETKGSIKQLSIQDEAKYIAFLADTSSSKKKDKVYDLYLSSDLNAVKTLSASDMDLPENWVISENGKISFANKTNRVFFATAPAKLKKDTTLLDEDIAKVDVWVWDEPVLHTQQLKNQKRDMKKSYVAVYHIDEAKAVQLETKKFTSFSPIKKGDADYMLASSYWPYAVQSMWEGYPQHQDFYLVDIYTGEAKMFKQDVRGYTQTSPDGNYVIWYNVMDTTYNTYEIVTGKEYQISNPKSIQVANELNDVPNPPGSYSIAGWIKDDEAILIYDRYDIWKVDPRGSYEPVNLTINGRTTGVTYRLKRFDLENRWDNKGIDASKTALLSGHNNINRHDGYYKFSLKKANTPKALIEGPFMIGRSILKAKDEEVYVYTKEDFQTYPNLLVTDKNFKKSVQVSDAAPQQDEFIWGTAELYEWTSLDGRKLQGKLHKPANFDPNKKYPMIVNFYEKSSQRLYSYHLPSIGRSTIDYHYYTSQGYVIFNPDVYYKTGYPGEDAFNCVMPGITQLIKEGYIDEDRIAAQGHSWGGYQVAYMATRTNLFACIESGAPVVNMFSAYGGIRWGSGLNRSFQYEHTQSRIGKSIWESPLRYIENSPIFTMDKVNTPILIMHNDDDGAVPWYQGIEYFIALRRLEKPVWMLNYNDADHWPLRLADRLDFQIRMSQFFHHYLKDAPMPKWMKDGVPATKKGYEFGLELED
ncbi:MAG: peptidase S9 [Bacteroidetes bacterium]|nr:peptidase S9 [Bacteroidota bacterium]